MRTQDSIILMFILTLLATTGNAAEKPPLPISELPAFTISPGQVIYQRYCLFCHGEKGEGDGQNGFSLPTRPADLNMIIPERNDKQLFAVIQQGGAKSNLSPAMPAFENTFSERQIKQLILFLKNFVKKD